MAFRAQMRQSHVVMFDVLQICKLDFGHTKPFTSCLLFWLIFFQVKKCSAPTHEVAVGQNQLVFRLVFSEKLR